MQLLGRLPGFGPRSARRAVLHLIKKRESLMLPIISAMEEVSRTVRPCGICGNLDESETCRICRDPLRDPTAICVVADVADLWAIERTAAFKGRYHVLGGLLSALDGIGPDQLALQGLLRRIEAGGISEVILALGATVDGQTTAHYLNDRLQDCGVNLSRLAHGVPVGGELDYLDDGTLIQALKARQRLA